MKASPENFNYKVRKILEKYNKEKEKTGYEDLELRHWELDNLMFDYLTKIGCGEGIELIKKTPKWYS